MNVFYNKEGIGDTLIISIVPGFEGKTSFERKGNVALIKSDETGETLGYNVFAASEYINVTENGQVDMNKDRLEEINQILKQNGFDTKIKADFTPKFVVGFVESKEKHPNADKLSVCKVNVGEETLQIVCGAPNVDQNQKVVVAKVGAVMPSGMVIKDAELRGIPSSGMICSAKELNLPNAPQEKGILVLDDHYQVGQAFNS